MYNKSFKNQLNITDIDTKPPVPERVMDNLTRNSKIKTMLTKVKVPTKYEIYTPAIVPFSEKTFLLWPPFLFLIVISENVKLIRDKLI